MATQLKKTHSGQVRIIGGQYKRTKLQVPDLPGLRPTPDRVRETLFNWLGQDLTSWRCVDAFAGSGALGFEAASRGAAHVLMCEQHPALVAQLKAVQTKLQATSVQVERGDGVACLRRVPAASLDLVFLDPPFDAGLFEPALKAAVTTLKAHGFIYLEAPAAWSDEALVGLGLQAARSGRAGQVWFYLLGQIPSGEEAR